MASASPAAFSIDAGAEPWGPAATTAAPPLLRGLFEAEQFQHCLAPDFLPHTVGVPHVGADPAAASGARRQILLGDLLGPERHQAASAAEEPDLSDLPPGLEERSAATLAERRAEAAAYTPGKTLARNAAFGASAPLTMLPLGGEVLVEGTASIGTAVGGGRSASTSAMDQDAASECSTTDTLGRALPPSPERGLDSDVSPFSPAISAVSGASPQPPPLRPTAPAAPLPVLRLSEALPEPELGSAELPSRGSAGHRLGKCKPCAFNTTKGCASGLECKFCHLCQAGEKKRRQKAMRTLGVTGLEMQASSFQEAAAVAWAFSPAAWQV